jgi:N-acetylglucosamine malate deacetylase 1
LRYRGVMEPRRSTASLQGCLDAAGKERQMKLLAMMAHPDDAEIWAGGTLFKHTQRGDQALIVYMAATADSVRGEEAKRGAALLGAEVAFVGLTDGQVRDTSDACARASVIVKRFAPDLLITHWLDDFHADHAATAAIVQRVLPSVMADFGKSLRLWACDTYFSMGTRGPFVPDVYVDVTSVWSQKLAAIRAHQSQRPEAWVVLMERHCGLHGQRYGQDDDKPAPFYAEGFKRLMPFGYIAPVDYLDA